MLFKIRLFPAWVSLFLQNSFQNRAFSGLIFMISLKIAWKSDLFRFGFYDIAKKSSENLSSDSALHNRRMISISKMSSTFFCLRNLESVDWAIFEVTVCHDICRFWTKTREFWAKSGFFRLEFQNRRKYGFSIRLSGFEAGKSRNENPKGQAGKSQAGKRQARF